MVGEKDNEEETSGKRRRSIELSFGLVRDATGPRETRLEHVRRDQIQQTSCVRSVWKTGYSRVVDRSATRVLQAFQLIVSSIAENVRCERMRVSRTKEIRSESGTRRPSENNDERRAVHMYPVCRVNAFVGGPPNRVDALVVAGIPIAYTFSQTRARYASYVRANDIFLSLLPTIFFPFRSFLANKRFTILPFAPSHIFSPCFSHTLLLGRARSRSRPLTRVHTHSLSLSLSRTFLFYPGFIRSAIFFVSNENGSSFNVRLFHGRETVPNRRFLSLHFREYIYINIYIYIYIYVYMYIYIYIYLYMYVYVYIFIHTCIHIHTHLS